MIRDILAGIGDVDGWKVCTYCGEFKVDATGSLCDAGPSLGNNTLQCDFK